MSSGLAKIRRAGLRLEEISAHEGRCLVANQDFSAGSVLLVETPVVRDHVAELASSMAQRRGDFDLLRGDQNLAAAEVTDKDAAQPFMLEAETNSFMFQGKVVGFNVFSMLNHACAASSEENVCFTILSTGDVAINDTLEVKLVAIRDIKAGEALRISYHELYSEPGARQERIRAHCGGFCACSRCNLEREDPDLAATLQLCIEGSAKCQVCSSCSEKSLSEGVVIELDLRDLKGATGILRENHSDGKFVVEVIYRGQQLHKTVPREAVRRFGNQKSESEKDLMVCGACKSMYFCSRSCQREGWKAHKRFCFAAKSQGSLSGWQLDRDQLEGIRKKYEAPYNRQAASELELTSAFQSFEFFIEKWTQVGRSPHLGSGHQAVQEAILFAIPIGSLLLWKVASREQQAADIYGRLLKLVHMNLRNVRLLVPRFHIAHWTALYYVNGLLLAKELVQGLDSSQSRMVKALSADFEHCLDIADVFDPNVADSFRLSVQSEAGAQGQGSHLFQEMSQDPSKLAAFYSIDPELPLEQKMEEMARLLAKSNPSTSRISGRGDNQPSTNKSKMTKEGSSSPASTAWENGRDTQQYGVPADFANKSTPVESRPETKPLLDLNILD